MDPLAKEESRDYQANPVTLVPLVLQGHVAKLDQRDQLAQLADQANQEKLAILVL